MVSKNLFPLRQVEYRKSPQKNVTPCTFLLYLYSRKIKTKLPIQYSLRSLAIIFTMWEIVFFFFLAFTASLIKPHTQSPSMDCALVCISLHFLVHPSASPRGRRGRPLTLKSDERERARPNLCGDAELDANWRVSATGRWGRASWAETTPPPSFTVPRLNHRSDWTLPENASYQLLL